MQRKLMLHLICYRGVCCETPFFVNLLCLHVTGVGHGGGGEEEEMVKEAEAEDDCEEGLQMVLTPPHPPPLVPRPAPPCPAPPRPALPALCTKYAPIGSAFILHACTQLVRSCVGTLAYLSSWSYVAKAFWPVRRLMQVAQGASESHGRDEGQRPPARPGKRTCNQFATCSRSAVMN